MFDLMFTYFLIETACTTERAGNAIKQKEQGTKYFPCVFNIALN